MTNASSTPGTAAKIDDLLGSALAVATVIQVAWPNRVHRPKTCVRSAPEGRPQRGRRRPGPRGGCIGDRALALESDVSCDMAVGDEELDAITRLLGEALDQFLAGS
jgi:hypothetical protein